jgi:hypothetical protein
MECLIVGSGILGRRALGTDSLQRTHAMWTLHGVRIGSMGGTSNICPLLIHQNSNLFADHIASPTKLFKSKPHFSSVPPPKHCRVLNPPFPPSILATPSNHHVQILFRPQHEGFGVGQSLLQSVQLARRRQPHCVAAPLQWKPAQTGVARPIDRPTKRSAPTRKNQEPRKSRIATHATGSGVGSHVVCGSPLVLVFVVVPNLHQRRVFQLPKGGMHVWRRLQVQTRH